MANHKESNHFQLVNALVVNASQLGLSYGDLLNILDPIPYHKELTLDMLYHISVSAAFPYTKTACCHCNTKEKSMMRLLMFGTVDCQKPCPSNSLTGF